MTGTINGTSGTGVSGQGRRRARQPVPRTRRVELTLSGEEYAILVEAAGQAGMARRAYAAQAALTAAANGNPISDQEPLALVLRPDGKRDFTRLVGAAPATAGGPREASLCAAGVALLDAGRARGPDAERR